MTDRPILFSGPMVQAILAGRKTQFRLALGEKNMQPPDVVMYSDDQDAQKMARAYCITKNNGWRVQVYPDHEIGDKLRVFGEPNLILTVTNVRVQRLQKISEADAVAEGGDESQARMYPELGTCRDFFADLWNNINGPDAWQKNPWVAAYSFTVEHENIDSKGDGK